MKRGPILFAALVAIALFILHRRKQAAAAAQLQAADVAAGPPPPTGAPVPTLAEEQTGLLYNILSSLHPAGTSTGSSSPTGTTRTSGTTGSPSKNPPPPPPPVRYEPAPPGLPGGALNQDQRGSFIQQGQQGGAGYRSSATSLGVGPVNSHASSGFGSNSFQNLSLAGFWSSLMGALGSLGGFSAGGAKDEYFT